MTHIKSTITVYRTEDGREFTNEWDAVIHDNVLQYNKFGEFGHFSEIERIEKEV